MKLVNIALVSVVVLGIAAVGCKKQDDDGDGTLGSSEAQLVADNSESSGTDDDLESGVDEPLSGAGQSDPGDPADGASDDELLGKVKANAGLFFKPGGCLLSTIDGNKIHHAFNHCTGPWGMVDFNGTVTSTYVRTPDSLTITHAADGLTANGAQISGQRVIVYTRSGSVITKTRTGTWTGTTAKGKPISHDANFVTTYDTSSKCLTRDGSAQTTLANRSFEGTIDGYKRCGIGLLGCPDGGKLTLSKTKSSDTLTLTVEFLGGVHYEVTRPNGTSVERTLICNVNAG